MPQQPFAGFALPTSNTTYTPNQFFDVCLPYSSRGTVRIVAFILRKTLGWCDADGNPQNEQHAVSYADFEEAGISRGMIQPSLMEALQGHFIRCIRPPQTKKAGQPAVSGLYELQWDSRGVYLKDPKAFRGFFAGEGNRTYIPNQFFDALVPAESLAVLKVVGSILRFSIGFANKWGHRRRNVALSYQHIQNYAHLRDRTSLSAALQHALKANYIERVEKGVFDPDAGKLSKAAVYALRWAEVSLNTAANEAIGLKTRPAENSANHRSKNPTGIGSKTRPAHRYENPTDIEIKQENKTYKQQDDVAASFEKLKAEGFDAKSAQAIASQWPSERIDRQIRWLEGRNIKSNRLGMLRAAIEQDWPRPGPTVGKGQLGTPNLRRSAGETYGGALERARERLNQRTNPFTP
jgi:hypothetical protein